MAYDPNTGAWKYEDDSVEGRVKGLVDVNNPLMQQARTQGMQSASRRGLINSSISAGAAQAAVVDKAVPIATADANITAQKNLSAQGFTQNKEIVGIQEQGQNTRLDKQLTAQRDIAAGEQAAAKERLGMQLTAQERIALEDRNAAMDRTRFSETEATTRARNSDAAARDRTIISETGANARNDATIRANTQSNVASNATQLANIRSSTINAITSNPNIPADARQSLIAQVETYYAADVETMASVFNVAIPYRAPTAPPPPPSSPDSLAPYTNPGF